MCGYFISSDLNKTTFICMHVQARARVEVRGQKLVLSVWVLGMELSYQVLFPAEPSRPPCAAILNVVPQTSLCMCFPQNNF